MHWFKFKLKIGWCPLFDWTLEISRWRHIVALSDLRQFYFEPSAGILNLFYLHIAVLLSMSRVEDILAL